MKSRESHTAVSGTNTTEHHPRHRPAEIPTPSSFLPPLLLSLHSLLDLQGDGELSPEDAANFDAVVFGGILGDHPPRDRTGCLRRSAVALALRLAGKPGRVLALIQRSPHLARCFWAWGHLTSCYHQLERGRGARSVPSDVVILSFTTLVPLACTVSWAGLWELASPINCAYQ